MIIRVYGWDFRSNETLALEAGSNLCNSSKRKECEENHQCVMCYNGRDINFERNKYFFSKCRAVIIERVISEEVEIIKSTKETNGRQFKNVLGRKVSKA